MIILKHKITGKEWTYSATIWFKRGYDINDYDILDWYDVVELFHDKVNRVSDGKMERRDAVKIIDQQPYIGYWLEDVSRPDLNASLLPTNTPLKKSSVPIAANIKPVISKTFKNDYIKYTIIGVVVFIIGYFLTEWFKNHKW